MLDNYIENLKDDMIKDTCNLINFPSVSEKTNDPSQPFGKSAKDALEYILNLGQKLGFRTKNIDNYCGYIEFGEGEKLLGIIGHLDVVPSGDGWDTPPFCATVKNNKIYGRGAIDDKGPVIASLYAMKAIKDNMNINSRVRLILGLNEEKDWECIEYYKQNEELPNIGFSPDANFPCIYAEKRITTLYLKEDFSKYNSLPIKISNINCNNNAINVVPKYCEVSLIIDTEKVNPVLLEDFITVSTINTNIDYSICGNTITLISHGEQAHAAHPELGKNAISPMIVLLNKIFGRFNCNINLFNFFEKYIGTEFDGKSLDLNFSDESGVLSLNVGDLNLNDNILQIGLNLRIPVTISLETVMDLFSKKSKDYSIELNITHSQNPLYVPKDDYLVKTLCDIFNRVTNSNLEPIAIGGGTYARAFNNCVSFGATFPQDTDMCHQANEFIDINNMVLACKIYAEAIYELAK